MARPIPELNPRFAGRKGPSTAPSCDLLMIAEKALWPMDQGYRVHGCNAARWLSGSLGLNVKIATLEPTAGKLPTWLHGMLVPWPVASAVEVGTALQGWRGLGYPLRRRLASHQGIEPWQIAGLLPLIKALRPNGVIALGPHGPVLLQGLVRAYPKLPRVWYAADEPVLFHGSCARQESPWRWPKRLRQIAVMAGIERAFAPAVQGVIGVSPRDTAALKRMTGAKVSATLRNGVDLRRYQPSTRKPLPKTIAFWGNLGFEPNAQGLGWFLSRVWPGLVYRHPDAKMMIMGGGELPSLRAMADHPGIQWMGRVDDIRPHTATAQVAILPMFSGAGIKNKLLEASAMGMAILATSTAVRGLEYPLKKPPFLIEDKAQAWTESIERLWSEPGLAQTLRTRARAWVQTHHRWTSVAQGLSQVVEKLAKRQGGTWAPATPASALDLVQAQEAVTGGDISEEPPKPKSRPARPHAA